MSGPPTWVLLRGLMREQRHWGHFPATLAHALPGARIVTPDLPGNGTRHLQTSATRVADMVEDCRRQLLERGIPAPYHLLALSLGGMVAVEWASRYPQEIARCVLVTSSAAGTVISSTPSLRSQANWPCSPLPPSSASVKARISSS